jgi:DNA-binding transcriptional regulator YiaG
VTPKSSVNYLVTSPFGYQSHAYSGLVTTSLEMAQALRELPTPAMRRAIRLEAGLSQKELAQDLGVTQVALARYESGQRRPRGARLLAYVELLRTLRALTNGST